MPSYTTSVGNVQLLSLNDGMPVRSPFAPFPDTTIEQWRASNSGVSFLSFWTTTTRLPAQRFSPRLRQVATRLWRGYNAPMADARLCAPPSRRLPARRTTSILILGNGE